jgi:uncharacterized protein GlcG (DUF336 family)
MRTKHALTHADVKKMLAACEAEAAKNKWAVSISIVDDGGYLMGFQRMDGAAAITAEVSMGKARSRPAFLSRAACRSCMRTNASARSAFRACNRTRTRWSRRRA